MVEERKFLRSFSCILTNDGPAPKATMLII